MYKIGRLKHHQVNIFQIIDHQQEMWDLFKKNHYSGETLAPASRCFVGACALTNKPLVFCAVRSLVGKVKNGWYTHKTAFRTDDVSIVTSFNDAVGEYLLREGKILYGNIPIEVREAFIGEYREHSQFWKATNHNLKTRAIKRTFKGWKAREDILYRHKFIGDSDSFILANCITSPHRARTVERLITNRWQHRRRPSDFARNYR